MPLSAYLRRLALAAALLFLAAWLSLFILSPFALTGKGAWLAMFGTPDNSLPYKVMHGIRLPRAIGAMCLGAALSAAGALMQTLTRNPLASPGILGVNAGAVAAMIFVSVFAPAWVGNITSAAAAAIGGGCAWVLVMLIGWRKNGLSKQRLILAGIAVSAFCAAVSKAALILHEDSAYSVMNWLAGSVQQVRWEQAQLLAAGTLPVLAFCLFLAPRLNLLALGDDTARALGVRLGLLRFAVCAAVLVLAGLCVSVAGPVAFLPLLVPHMARFAFGYDLRRLLPAAMLLGALFMLLADILGRALSYPQEMPAGAVAAVLGAPCFVWLAVRGQGRAR